MKKLFLATITLLATTFPATSQEVYHFPDCTAGYCIQAVFVNPNLDFDPDTISPDDDRFVFLDDFAFYVNSAGEYLYEHGIETQTASENTSSFMANGVEYTWPDNLKDAYRIGFVFRVTDSATHDTTMFKVYAIDIGSGWILDESGRWKEDNGGTVIFLEKKE
ncbi:MAG: hypothetical protein II899_11480 [Bacteroidales bacterium]|nr:hypothetical protein [Bacteroidales bacterium]